MKIVVLTHRSETAIYLCAKIASVHQLTGVFFERSAENKIRKAASQFRRNKRKRGLWFAIKRGLELPFAAWLDAAYSRSMTKHFGELNRTLETDSWPEHEISSVNKTEVVRAVQELAPEVICVLGTGILKKPIIGIPDKCVLNIHTGILPQYRGAKSELWTLANGDLKNVGVTVHVIDEGVDTGPIVKQERITVGPDDDHLSLRCRNIVKGVDLLLEALDQLEKGDIRTIQQDKSAGRNYSTPTISAYLKMKSALKSING